MRCFVTGGSGFVGSHLVRYLLARGCEVAILLRPQSDPWRLADCRGAVQVLRTGTGASDELVRYLRTFRPNVIFHAGWSGMQREKRGDLEQLQNITDSVSLLKATADTGCGCFVGLGSQAEYGRQHGIVAEDRLPRPDSLYGATKLAVGTLLAVLAAQQGMRFVWARLCYLYGPADDESHLVPYVILSLLRGQRPALTAGMQRRDCLHVHDAVRALWSVATTTRADGAVNVGDGQAPTVRQIAEYIRDMIDPSLPLGLGDLGNGRDFDLRADASRLQYLTGWRPNLSLEEGLRETINWYRHMRANRAEFNVLGKSGT